MTHDFDREYWDGIWAGDRGSSMATSPPNPHLIREISGLAPERALEAGCGAGSEALWLAMNGWQVTAVDVASAALDFAARRAADLCVAGRVQWLNEDLSTWQPDALFDLVTTHYAHPAMPQLEFYERLAGWVAPGGTLFIVGHLHQGGHDHGEHGQGGHGHDEAHDHRGPQDTEAQPPASASATADAITSRLSPEQWEIVTAAEVQRTLLGPGGRPTTIHDVVVRATRRG